MKVEWKACFRVGISVFLVFLGIYYWGSVTKWAWLIVGAASPLLIGVIIAYVLNILMSFYERLWFPRSRSKFIARSRRVICLVLAIVTLLGIVAAVIGLVVPELIASVQLLIQLVIDWVPEAIDKVSNSESLSELIPADLLHSLESIDWKGLVDKAVEVVSSGIGGAVGTVAGVITSVFSTVVTVFVAVIFALYLLISKDRLLNQANRMLDVYVRPNINKQIRHVLDVLNDCFHRYVVGQCLEAVILGTLCMVGMFIFRFPYATMIGTLVGFTALIPIAGAYIGAAVGAFMILTVSPLQAILFVVYLTVLQQLEGNLIYPRVVGSSLGLPGMWVLAAVTIGGGLFGIVGMLIGVPLAAAVYRLLREDVRRREKKDDEDDFHGRKRHHRKPNKSAQGALEQDKPKESHGNRSGNGQSGRQNLQNVTNQPKGNPQSPKREQRTRQQTKKAESAGHAVRLEAAGTENRPQGTQSTAKKRRKRSGKSNQQHSNV